MGIGAQQGPPGGAGDPLGAAHRHHAVLHDRPVQQQAATADALEVEPGVELAPGLELSADGMPLMMPNMGPGIDAPAGLPGANCCVM